MDGWFSDSENDRGKGKGKGKGKAGHREDTLNGSGVECVQVGLWAARRDGGGVVLQIEVPGSTGQRVHVGGCVSMARAARSA